MEVVIQKALEIKDLDYLKLAKLDGFNEEQIKFAKIFWQPDMNNSWFYIGKEMVVDWLGYTDSKNTMNDFHIKLIKDYENNEEYKEVDKDNDLVKKFYSGNIRNEKLGNRAKYYIITGECLKGLLLSANTAKGKEVRKYFIKVEKLAQLMYQVIREKQLLESKEQLQIKEQLLFESAEKLKKIEEGKMWIHKASKSNVLFNEFVDKTDGIYIGSCASDRENGILKIGKAIDNKERERELASSGSAESAYKMDKKYEIFVGMELATEKYIHALLAPFHVNARKKPNHRGSTEFFMSNPNFVDRVISKTIAEQNETIMIINEYNQFVRDHDCNIPSIEYTYDNYAPILQIENVEEPIIKEEDGVDESENDTLVQEEILYDEEPCNICVHTCKDDAEECDCECICDVEIEVISGEEVDKTNKKDKKETKIRVVTGKEDPNTLIKCKTETYEQHYTERSNYGVTASGTRAQTCNICKNRKLNDLKKIVIDDISIDYDTFSNDDKLKVESIKNELDLITLDFLRDKSDIIATKSYKKCSSKDHIGLSSWILKTNLCFSNKKNGKIRYQSTCRECKNIIERARYRLKMDNLKKLKNAKI